ncbi:glycoside hydrolase family 36 N-terminal domain-containing protein [Streptomyces sp. NPDC019507]|uniref:glycoside hydrolase family 36 N-terminal domain-containing protein n=1 Tax=Streptomyces sp. NPDC019507 TaxID=3154689 RepID=UPI0033CC9982
MRHPLGAPGAVRAHARARGTEWRIVAAHEADGGEGLRLDFEDQVHGLALGLHHGLRDAADVIEHWVTLTHAGTGPRWSRCGPARPSGHSRRPTAAVSHRYGTWADESRFVRSEPTPGEKLIGSRRGRTGHQHVPWGAAATARPPRRRGRCGRPTVRIRRTGSPSGTASGSCIRHGSWRPGPRPNVRLNGRVGSPRLRFASAMAGALGIDGDLTA